MGQVMKAYLGLFFLLLVAIVGMGVVTAGIEAAAARNYHADVINEIECSNFNPYVMEGCVVQAQAAGYGLQIEPMVYDEENHMQTAKVILKYNYSIKAIDLTTERQIRGFAR